MMLRPSETTINRIGIAILAIGVIAMVVIITSKQMRREGQRGDLEVYVHASHLILEGRNIYETPTERGRLYYVYPPLFAVLTIPLTPLPPVAMLAFWCLLNIFLACWIVAVFFRTMSGRSFFSLSTREKWVLGFIPLVMSGRAIIYNADLAQANLLVCAVAVLGLSWLAKGREISSGVVVGLSVVLKVLTAPLILLFAVRRDYRFSIAAIVGITVGLFIPALAVGWGQNVAYLDHWFREIVSNTDVTSNQSWHFNFNFSPEAQLFRFFSHLPGFEIDGRKYYLSVIELPKGTIQMLGKAIVGILWLCITFYAWRFRKASTLIGLWGGVALCFCLMPILSPVTQKHYFALMLPAHVYVVYLWYSVRLDDRPFRILVVTSFVWMTFTTNIVGSSLGAVMTGLGGLIWSTLVLAAAIFRAAYVLEDRTAERAVPT
jgi:hypothetical protein